MLSMSTQWPIRDMFSGQQNGQSEVFKNSTQNDTGIVIFF